MARRETDLSRNEQPRRSGGNRGRSTFTAVTTRRHGAPPLHFKGAELARHECNRKDISATITLWESKTRGFVAAVECKSTSDSASRANIDELMTWLEQLVQPGNPRLKTAPCGDGTPVFGSVDAARNRQALRILAGEALENWDRIANDRESID